MKSLYILAVLATVAAPLAAQRVQVYETTPRPDVVLRSPGAVTYTTSGRAIIGVMIDTRPSGNDSIGATVSGVTPGGPAARAGLLGGDIITKVDGTALVDRRRRTEDDQQSVPGLRLVELIARVEPGDTVAVEWKRGSERQRRTARIATEPAAGMVMSDGPQFRVYTDQGPGMYKFNFEDGPRRLTELQGRLEALRGPMAMALPGMDGGHVFLRLGGPFGGVQFAPLNADLGRYFGTTEGILVLETPDTSAHVDLKGGDVILSVDGRKPAGVEQLMRILGSYDDDETVNFDVMRDKRHVAVTAKAQDIRGGGRMRMIEREL
ncbi:MAG TPA: PDZ domain-containing protein, partial [Gemmatimonadales bacterium]|nr:PDZ domain-containing protein [Gemmatimonadales bacterium]